MKENFRMDGDDSQASDAEKDGEQSDSSAESGFDFSKKSRVPKKKAAPKKQSAVPPVMPPMPMPSKPTTSQSSQSAPPSASETAELGSQAPTETTSAPSTRVTGKGGKRSLEKAAQDSESLMTKLKQFSFLQLWQQPTRCKEIDARVRKALDRCAQLEASESEAHTKLRSELQSLATRVLESNEIIGLLKKTEGNDQATECTTASCLSTHGAKLASTLAEQTADCIKPVILDLGKMLLEATDCLCRLVRSIGPVY